jgi:hypothetical protein
MTNIWARLSFSHFQCFAWLYKTPERPKIEITYPLVFSTYPRCTMRVYSTHIRSVKWVCIRHTWEGENECVFEIKVVTREKYMTKWTNLWIWKMKIDLLTQLGSYSMQLLFQKPADDEAWPTCPCNHAKKGLKIPEAVSQRRTNNTMVNIKRTIWQKAFYQTLHRTKMIKQHEPHLLQGVNTCFQEE